MTKINRLLFRIRRDPYIPLILLFSFIVSFSVVFSTGSSFEKSQGSNFNVSVLGIEDKQNICRPGQCGSCNDCGGSFPGLNCGRLSRCVNENDRYYCRFDLNCY